MKAIILSAGRGKRMGALTNDKPKCLLTLNDKPLIEWQMEAIRDAGIAEIAIVKGYLGHRLNFSVTYFENKLWDKTNMLYTLYCADEWLRQDDCLVSYADIVYSSEAVRRLIAIQGEIAISFDRHWRWLWEKRFIDPLSDAEIFNYSNDILQDIGGPAKRLDDIQGQYMGLLKFTPAGWQDVKNLIAESPESLYELDMTSLLKLLIRKNIQIKVIPINSWWCEVDSPHDYQICQEIIK
jgi:choline kinase